MTSEDDTWAQTLITVTPEDDATLREIANTTVLSAPPDVPLDLDADNIVYRQPLTYKQFVDPETPEEENSSGEKKDAENQTYLQGVPVVDISVEYKDKASQTMYMSTPCPPLEYFKDIMKSMNDAPMPTLKKSNVAGTIISLHPKTPQDIVAEQLAVDITNEDIEEFASKLTEDEETEMEMTEMLNFLLTRAFWISDPTNQAKVQTNDEATQTSIRFNCRTKTIVLDNETQTGLTCEPKKSNTTLLSDYQETKNLILNCLEDCLSRGIEPRIIVEDIIDEIVDKCADRIRFPMKDQITQTIASYKLHEEKEEDILRKLKLEVIIDPLEASIVVVPLMDDLLGLVCDAVSQNASPVVENILNTILQRTMVIVIKLMEIRKEAQPKPMDQIFQQRRKKILESMLKKETETISTQTGIAGVPEVTRIKESKEVLCSVCRRHSMCHWCSADPENENVPQQEVKILRTQDILLAYKPCYVVATPSEKKKNPYLQSPCPSEKKIKKFPTPPLDISEESTEESSQTVNILLQPEKAIKAQDSVSGWSYIVDTALTKPWSVRGSMSSTSKITAASSGKSFGKKSSKSQTGLASQAVKALQILKNTFCTQETCTAASLEALKEDCSSDESDNTCIRSACDICSTRSNSTVNKIITKRKLSTQQTRNAFLKPFPVEDQRYLCRNRYTKRNRPQTPGKSRADGFKVIPICALYNSDL